MTQETSRLSDKYVWTALIGFIGFIGFGIGSTFIPNAKSYPYEILGIVSIFLGMFVISMIQIKRLDKRQCNLGQHNPDKLMICQDCNKRLEGSEDLIDQHNRNVDRSISTKRGLIKFIATSIGITVFAIVFAYYIFTSSHSEMINGINSMNSTDPTSCLYLVKQHAMEKGINAIMIGSHVIKAINQKWNEFDCIHKPILDDLNKTCPIGVIPTIQGFNGFLCDASETKK